MKLTTLEDLLTYELQDIYSAENQILEALPKMAQAASNEMLKKGFEEHVKQTEEHVKRLEEIRDELGIEIDGEKCKGMEGLLKEGEELLEKEPGPIVDQALISAAQRVEHYEIAAYGCAKTYATLLGKDTVADRLDTTLTEEGDTDKKLTEIAQKEIKMEQ